MDPFSRVIQEEYEEGRSWQKSDKDPLESENPFLTNLLQDQAYSKRQR
jgi:hypothetical protein